MSVATFLLLGQWNITMASIVYLKKVFWPHDWLWCEPEECFLSSHFPHDTNPLNNTHIYICIHFLKFYAQVQIQLYGLKDPCKDIIITVF